MPAASAFSTVFSGGQRFEEARLASSLATRSGARHSAGAKPKPGDTAFEAQAWHLPGTPAFYIYEDLLTWWKRACPVWVTAVSNVSVLASIQAERRKSVGGGDSSGAADSTCDHGVCVLRDKLCARACGTQLKP